MFRTSNTAFYAAVFAAAVSPLGGQTRVNLQSQSKNVDFSQASSVRPLKTGVTLPSVCSTGDMFFKTDAAAGSNLFGCYSPNTWIAQGASGSSDAGLRIQRTNATMLSIGADCTVPAPCRARIGSIVYTLFAPATATAGAGSGTVYIYVNRLGGISLGISSVGSPSVSCSGCQVDTPITQFPVDSLPLAIWEATSGTWDVLGADSRATLSAGRRLTAGANVMITEVGSNITIAAANNGFASGTVVDGATMRLSGPVPASSSYSLLGAGDPMTAGNVNGTVLGINVSNSYAGDLANWLKNNSSLFRVDSNGDMTLQGTMLLSPSQVRLNSSGATATLWANFASDANASARLAVQGVDAGNELQLGAGASANSIRLNGLGKMALGTASPIPGASAAASDLLVQDATPATGNTQVQVQAGAGQNRDLMQFLNAAGTAGSRVSVEGALVNLPFGTKPTCDVPTRGMLWHTQSGVGVPDSVEACVKNAADVYVWTALF